MRGLVYIVVLLISCYGSAQENVVLQLKWAHQFQFAGYYMAKEKGFYEQAGLNVSILPADTSIPDTQFKVLAGQAHFGVTHSALLQSRMQGKPLVALAAIFQSSPYCWMVKEDSQIYEPRDFIGKRISYLGKAENAELMVMLKQAGVDIRKLPLYSGLYPMDDFKKGLFDALQVYVTNEPFKMRQAGIATRQICPKQYGVNVYGDILFTTENLIEQKPQLVEKFRQASLKGWRYAMLNMHESIDVIRTLYNPEKTKEQLAYEADTLRPFVTQAGISIGSMSETRWRWIAQLYGYDQDKHQNQLDSFVYHPQTIKAPYQWSWMLVAASILTFLCIPLYLHLIFSRHLKYRIAHTTQADKKGVE
ncbi:ABC transporter substrate-binding protein [Pseudoalteromonas sp. JBTF-M23]|uniref:Thiamine pyrimidine synthase n=1 Tax=Pseudoalteromonas caenipelagi TaxID=2726988 RepID=A0A849VCU8_9GAMM|nr:ABC transporter substrate-binding protein [Pseudoalteromonas caenipelagi]NOU51126.1 ABC transporter substrate-binding protein [Pseudoalteromonas caenipelagi]